MQLTALGHEIQSGAGQTSALQRKIRFKDSDSRVKWSNVYFDHVYPVWRDRIKGSPLIDKAINTILKKYDAEETEFDNPAALLKVLEIEVPIHNLEKIRGPDDDVGGSSEASTSEGKKAKAPAIPPVPLRLYPVTASSSHHDINQLRSMAPSAAGKGYGFSFVDKDVEAEDILAINAYVKDISAKGSSALAVSHGPATHAGAKSGMVQYSVNGRVYSTHAATTQLFPVGGIGVESGKGPDQMLALLKRKGLLDLAMFYSVKYRNTSDLRKVNRPWDQTGRERKAQIQSEFEAY